MYCKQCGFQLVDDSKYCLKCGCKLHESSLDNNKTKPADSFLDGNALICKMCNSNSLVKESDEYYVCQACGTKYANSMVNKFIVEINGSVKADPSDRLRNLYILARRATKNCDNEKARDYYASIIQLNPENWEPCFYVDYLDALLSDKYDDYIKRIEIIRDSVNDYITMLGNNTEDYSERSDAISSIALSLSSMIDSDYRLYYMNELEFVDDNSSTVTEYDDQLFKFNRLAFNSIEAFLELGSAIYEVLGKAHSSMSETIINYGLSLCDDYLKDMANEKSKVKCFRDKKEILAVIIVNEKKVKELKKHYTKLRDSMRFV